MATYPSISNSSLTRAALLGLLSILPACAQSHPNGKYVFSIAASSERISSGEIWLYSYSWYGLQKIQLAAIENGLALVSLDAAKLKRQLDPIRPRTAMWSCCRLVSADGTERRISRRTYYGAIYLSLWILSGERSNLATGETQVILPPPSKRRVTLLYPNGQAAANANITLSIYLWNMNHCGFHEGLPLGTYRTDKTGTIEFLAPLVALYLDGISYYEKVGTGLANLTYSHNSGLKTGPEQNLLLQEQWELTDDDDFSEDVELRVLTATGQPRKEINVYGNWLTNTCGGGDRIGQTDSRGMAQISLNPSFTHLGTNGRRPLFRRRPQVERKFAQLDRRRTPSASLETQANHSLVTQ